MRRWGGVGATLLLAVLAGGCANDPDQPAQRAVGGDAPTASVIVPPSRSGMTVDPAEAAPGDEVALGFERPNQVRGIAYSLADGDGEVLYYLTSAGGVDGGEPSWWSAEDAEGRGWVDVGVTGPDRLVVPDTIESGSYLLCTENSVHELCASLTVTP